MSKNLFQFFLLTTSIFYSILFYYTYQYYNNVELVEIPVEKECKLDHKGGGTAHPTSNYIIHYQGKIYDRKYKVLGFSNLLWSKDNFYDNIYTPKESIYFYRLKSDKNLQETSRYFLPSANKPITNKIILVLDIWGYFMTNWFWYLFLYLASFMFLANNQESETKNEKVKWYEKTLIIGYIVLLLMTFFY